VVIRTFIRDEGAYAPDEVEILISAYESALQEIGLEREDPLALMIARKVIALAKSGERDPKKLCASVITALRLNSKGKVA
jgi:hypothetical protein